MPWLKDWGHLVAGRKVDEIVMRTARDATSILYEVLVVLDDSYEGDEVRAWCEAVTFRGTDAAAAGGAAFRLAAREQERIAAELWRRLVIREKGA